MPEDPKVVNAKLLEEALQALIWRDQTNGARNPLACKSDGNIVTIFFDDENDRSTFASYLQQFKLDPHPFESVASHCLAIDITNLPTLGESYAMIRDKVRAFDKGEIDSALGSLHKYATSTDPALRAHLRKKIADITALLEKPVSDTYHPLGVPAAAPSTTALEGTQLGTRIVTDEIKRT